MLLLFPGENAARDTLRFAEEVAGYGLWQVDFASGRMEYSTNTYNLLGLSPTASDNVGARLGFQTFETVAHPEDVAVVGEIQRILVEGLPIDRQFRVVHPNGRVRSLAIHGEALVGRGGKPDRVVGVLMDITRHVETVMTSQINADRIRELMTAIGGAIWSARADGFYSDFLMRDSRGQGTPVIPGNNWRSVVHPDDLDKMSRTLAKATADKSIFVSEHRVRDTTGQYQWRRAYATPLLTEDGTIREWVGLSLAIHEKASGGASDDQPLTGAQIRAARGILNWSVRDLSSRTGLSVGVVRRLEETDGVSKNAADPLNLIKDALSAGGVDFFVLPGGEAGVYPVRKDARLKIVAQNGDRKINSA